MPQKISTNPSRCGGPEVFLSRTQADQVMLGIATRDLSLRDPATQLR